VSSLQDQEKAIARVLAAIETIKRGGMVIMVDDEDRENEGDLVFSAEHVSAEKINFMAKEARGLICLTLSPEYVDKLKLPLMNTSGFASGGRMTAFTVSIEARQGISTGISAYDRSHTIQVAINDSTTAYDLVVPGHVFPLRAKPGGVLERAGHTEGSVDLAKLAGKKSAAVICEIMCDDGTMARRSDLDQFSKKHDIPLVSIADLITFRLMKESFVTLVSKTAVKTTHGVFDGYVFKSTIDDAYAFALVKGQDFEDKVVDVRVHHQRPIEDVFACRDSEQPARIEYGLKMLQDSDNAVLLYLPDTMKEAGLIQQLAYMAVTPPDQETASLAPHTSAAQAMDLRLIGLGAQILRSLGVRKMISHMNVPRSLKGLSGFGLEVVNIQQIQSNHTHSEAAANFHSQGTIDSESVSDIL
jgi:3,4-dihydroxy 2-butanone 4-phosphate synthase/GTP cyclohydrolase II